MIRWMRNPSFIRTLKQKVFWNAVLNNICWTAFVPATSPHPGVNNLTAQVMPKQNDVSENLKSLSITLAYLMCLHNSSTAQWEKNSTLFSRASGTKQKPLSQSLAIYSAFEDFTGSGINSSDSVGSLCPVIFKVLALFCMRFFLIGGQCALGIFAWGRILGGKKVESAARGHCNLHTGRMWDSWLLQGHLSPWCLW